MFPSTEHLYQWMKFDMGSGGPESIRLASSPKEAATLGRTLSGIRPDWNDIKINTMEICLRLKLNQHPKLKQKLIDTGDAQLIESSNKDDFWGQLPNGNGRNELGKLWMLLRQELKCV